jgi:hypothetical protein
LPPAGVTTTPTPTRDGFDLPTYQRDKIRRLEQRVSFLQEYREQLIRILAFILHEQFRDTNVDALEYLSAVVSIDESLTALSYNFSTCLPGRRDFDTLGLPRQAASSAPPAKISDVEVPDPRRSR